MRMRKRKSRTTWTSTAECLLGGQWGHMEWKREVVGKRTHPSASFLSHYWISFIGWLVFLRRCASQHGRAAISDRRSLTSFRSSSHPVSPLHLRFCDAVWTIPSLEGLKILSLIRFSLLFFHLALPFPLSSVPTHPACSSKKNTASSSPSLQDAYFWFCLLVCLYVLYVPAFIFVYSCFVLCTSLLSLSLLSAKDDGRSDKRRGLWRLTWEVTDEIKEEPFLRGNKHQMRLSQTHILPHNCRQKSIWQGRYVFPTECTEQNENKMRTVYRMYSFLTTYPSFLLIVCMSISLSQEKGGMIMKCCISIIPLLL